MREGGGDVMGGAFATGGGAGVPPCPLLRQVSGGVLTSLMQRQQGPPSLTVAMPVCLCVCVVAVGPRWTVAMCRLCVDRGLITAQDLQHAFTQYARTL